MIKYILSALVGGAVGAGTTYLIMKKRFEKRLEAQYNAMTYESNKTTQNTVEARNGASERVTAVPDTRTKSSLDGGPVFTGQRVDYTTMAKNYMKSEKDLETVMAESEAPEEPMSELENPNPIHIISPNEYNSDSEAERVDLFWYPDPDILEDEYGEEVLERERLVGDCLVELKHANVMPTDESGLIFIRNVDLGVIYAVDVMSGDPNGGVN